MLDNDITNFNGLSDLRSTPLEELFLLGNPVAFQIGYRQRWVLFGCHLCMLTDLSFSFSYVSGPCSRKRDYWKRNLICFCHNINLHEQCIKGGIHVVAVYLYSAISKHQCGLKCVNFTCMLSLLVFFFWWNSATILDCEQCIITVKYFDYYLWQSLYCMGYLSESPLKWLGEMCVCMDVFYNWYTSYDFFLMYRVFAILPGLKFLDGVAKQDEDSKPPPPDEKPSSCVVSWIIMFMEKRLRQVKQTIQNWF